MSKKKHVPILFQKEICSSQSEVDEKEDDVWDDRKINDAYDRAMKVAGAEVAKRLAMSTNSKSENEINSTMKMTTSKKTCKPHKVWKAGMSCRALYYKDGIEYEAIIQGIINEDECSVKFLGYDNSEIVNTSSLKSSRGVQAQAKQIEEAVQANGEDCDSSFEDMRNSNQRNTRASMKHNVNLNDLPDIPPIPNMSMLTNMGLASEIPMPPPPPIALNLNGSESEHQVISSMLLSWYMSGYYTGLYQASKKAKKN